MTPVPGGSGEVLIAPEDFTLPPEPRVETDPRASLQFLLQQENRELNRYEWVSKDSGLVQVPIARAMQLVLEKGMLEAR